MAPHRYLRELAGGEGAWGLTLPLTCMRALDGNGDVGCGVLGTAPFSVYLCPLAAADPMSAVMMCGQASYGVLSFFFFGGGGGFFRLVLCLGVVHSRLGSYQDPHRRGFFGFSPLFCFQFQGPVCFSSLR